MGDTIALSKGDDAAHPGSWTRVHLCARLLASRLCKTKNRSCKGQLVKGQQLPTSRLKIKLEGACLNSTSTLGILLGVLRCPRCRSPSLQCPPQGRRHSSSLIEFGQTHGVHSILDPAAWKLCQVGAKIIKMLQRDMTNPLETKNGGREAHGFLQQAEAAAAHEKSADKLWDEWLGSSQLGPQVQHHASLCSRPLRSPTEPNSQPSSFVGLPCRAGARC